MKFIHENEVIVTCSGEVKMPSGSGCYCKDELFWAKQQITPLHNDCVFPSGQFAYLDTYMNGTDADAGIPFPGDGSIVSWSISKSTGGKYIDQGSRFEHVLKDIELKGGYRLGNGDRAYIEGRNRNYLARILREGKLRELEPAVWHLREWEHAQNCDIKDWWSEKLRKFSTWSLEKMLTEHYEQFLKQEEAELKTKQKAEQEAKQAAERQAKLETESRALLDSCRCSLCGKIMIDPVMAADGETYEREEIERYLQAHDDSPKTKQKLLHKNLIPNNAAKRAITSFLSFHPELRITDEVYISEALKQRLLAAVQKHEPETVTNMIKEDPRLLTKVLIDGRTLFSLALDKSSNPKVLRAVISELGEERFRAQPEIAAADGGVGCFRRAASNLGIKGAQAIAEALKWEQKKVQELFGLALENCDIDFARVCLDLSEGLGARLEVPDAIARGACPLQRMIAAYFAHPDEPHFAAVQFLVTVGANLEIPDANGDTPLLQAIRTSNARLFELLLTRKPHPANKEAKDQNGQRFTALHLAVELGNREFAKRLLETGANLEAVCPPTNDTVLLHAVRSNKPELLALILAQTPKSNLKAQDSGGNNALHLAARLGDTAKAQELALLLLDHGVDGAAMNAQGKRPEITAFEAGNRAMANAIQEKIVDMAVASKLIQQQSSIATRKQLSFSRKRESSKLIQQQSSIETPPLSSSSSTSALASLSTLPKLPRLTIPGLKAEDTIEFKDLCYTSADYLGEGSFAKVYRGTWQQKGGSAKVVAIKEFLMSGLSQQAEKELVHEATIMRQLRYFNIVHLFGICVEPAHCSLIIEYAPKGSLYHVLHSEELLNWLVRWNIALGISRGVEHLHNYQPQILHRDLKSLNVLLDANNVPKITDFGLSQIRVETRTRTHTTKLVDTVQAPTTAAGTQSQSSTKTAEQATQAHAVAGTAAWMAPELADPIPYTRACDIFSLGVILEELASRKTPWESVGRPVTDEEIQRWIRSGQREEIPRETPPTFAALIGRCWEQRAQDRPPISVVVQELEQHRNEVTETPIPPELICPITKEIMREPVIDNDGHSFEKVAIEVWVNQIESCPLSSKDLKLADLKPNLSLRDTIERFLADNPSVLRARNLAACGAAAAASASSPSTASASSPVSYAPQP